MRPEEIDQCGFEPGPADFVGLGPLPAAGIPFAVPALVVPWAMIAAALSIGHAHPTRIE